MPILTRFFVFFFSSRRRHTRSKRDWSSDVCSSDLVHALDADELALDAGLQPFLDRLAAEVPEIDLAEVDAQFGHLAKWAALEMRDLFDDLPDSEVPVRRSEEHTSELQSRFDLVCRL